MRETQGIAGYVSNCRAYELVSTGLKSVPVWGADISRSGDRAIYRFMTGGSDETTYGGRRAT